jgi:tRNA (guanine-N7-)-methyltransferase
MFIFATFNSKMGKDKLKRFEALKKMERVLQPVIDYHSPDHEIKGNWNKEVFNNSLPIVLEVGCGRGEYTVGLAQHYPEKNFIGIDIKGARLWRGVKTSNEFNILNTAFLRIRMECIGKFFAKDEVSEIWITFPDPQPKQSKENKRLSSALFISRYSNFVKPGGLIHLKTDNEMLFDFSLATAEKLSKEIVAATNNLYYSGLTGIDYAIRTTYEQTYHNQGKNICYLCFKM